MSIVGGVVYAPAKSNGEGNIFMIKNGKILGKFNLVDVVIVGVVAVLVLGVLLVKANVFNPISKVSKGEKALEFEITTRAYEVTAQEELFKVGEKTFITIRNVPYTELEIVNVKKENMKEMFFNEDRPEVPYLMNNVAYPHRFQYVVTLKDNAHITNDGAVIGGNKIKIGLPVDLEGFHYRLGGTVSNVKTIEEEQ